MGPKTSLTLTHLPALLASPHDWLRMPHGWMIRAFPVNSNPPLTGAALSPEGIVRSSRSIPHPPSRRRRRPLPQAGEEGGPSAHPRREGDGDLSRRRERKAVHQPTRVAKATARHPLSSGRRGSQASQPCFCSATTASTASMNRSRSHQDSMVHKAQEEFVRHLLIGGCLGPVVDHRFVSEVDCEK